MNWVEKTEYDFLRQWNHMRRVREYNFWKEKSNQFLINNTMENQAIYEMPETAQRFIGVKEIQAIPMNRKEYNDYRGWDLPSDEDGSDEGYLVEYLDGGKPNHHSHKGYISWSPKDVFKKAYRLTTGLSFGLAIEAAKKGKKVARAGWNGKNMYAVIMPGYPEGIEVNEVTRNAHNLPEGTKLVYRPYWQLYTAQSDVAMWAPSGSDSLAEDWMIVE